MPIIPNYGSIINKRAFTPVKGKKPYIKDWINKPVTYQEAKGYKTNGVGVLHKYADTCAIDIDNVEVFLQAIRLPLDELVKGQMQILSPKENTAKILCTLTPEQQDALYTRKLLNDKGMIVEFRMTGQDVMPGSAYPSGGEYTLKGESLPQPIPDVLLDFWTQSLTKIQQQSPPRSKLDDKRDNKWLPIPNFLRTHDLETLMLKYGYVKQGKRYLSPRQESGHAGCEIITSESRGQVLFSYSGSDGAVHGTKYHPAYGEINNAIDAAELYTFYEHNGDVNSARTAMYKMEFLDPNTGEILPSVELANRGVPDKPERKRRKSKEPMLDMTKVLTDDMFSKLVLSIVNSSDAIENPISALNEAFGIISLVSDVTYSFGGRTIPTHYGVNVGDTFAGKTVTRASALYHLREAGILSDHVQKSKSTFEALEDTYMDKLPVRPTILFNPDEIGFIFEASKKNNMFASLAQFILTAFSLDYGLHHKRNLVKKDENSKSVMSPKFTMIGGSTIESLKHGAITKQDAMNGDLNRKLILNVNGVEVHNVKRVPEGGYANEQVIDRIRYIWEKPINKPREGENLPKIYDRKKPLVIVKLSDDANEYNYEQRKQLVKDRVDSLRGRRALLSKLVALWRVVFNSPDDPIITKQDLIWADYIVSHSIDFTQYLFDVHLTENVSVDSEKHLIRVLHEAGILGLKRQTAMIKANWNNTLDSGTRNRKQDALIEEGVICQVKIKTMSGRASNHLVASEFLSSKQFELAHKGHIFNENELL